MRTSGVKFHSEFGLSFTFPVLDDAQLHRGDQTVLILPPTKLEDRQRLWNSLQTGSKFGVITAAVMAYVGHCVIAERIAADL